MIKKIQTYKIHLILICMMLCFTLNANSKNHPIEKHPVAKALILYDTSGRWDWIGYLDSLFLANLLGHFNRDYKILPVDDYTQGLIEQFDTIFYFGTIYDHPLPPIFIKDALNTTKNLVWFNYNLWQLNHANPKFSTQYGFRFDYVDHSGYPEISYKNTALVKNQVDPGLGRVSITNEDLAYTIATAQQPTSGQTIPYIVHGNNLWYIADIPFSYLTENDRYLAFADVLYDILEIEASPQKRAILRLEDVNPTYDMTLLRNIADYLYAQHVPFSFGVIPCYTDPYGYYNHGVPRVINMTDKPEFIETLKYMVSKGGTIIVHGYTHQYANELNPYVGVSGADYEFFRISIDPETGNTLLYQPVAEDSTEWVRDRVELAQALFADAGLDNTLWETPHYTASYIDNQFFATHFAASSGRIRYFDKDNSTHYADQFFPYVIHKDTYGGKIIPENLGCVSPYRGISYPTRSVEDVLVSANKNLVLRDAWASVCYHPFLGLSYLQTLIPELKHLGYEFVRVSSDLD